MKLLTAARPGRWVFVCGPSGAGKDSVIHWAREHLAARSDIVFARRMVTRASYPGSEHDAVTQQQFSRLLGAGGLVWRWEAHGLHYGVAAHYAAQVAAGCSVVVNGSREHTGALDAAPELRVVHITAAAENLAARLAQRGREAAHEVTRRLARTAQIEPVHAHCTIVNDGEIAQAGMALANYLMHGDA